MILKRWLIVALLLWVPEICFSAEKLIFALDVVRHGERAPIFSIPTVNYQWKDGVGQLTAKGMRQEFDLGQLFRKRYIESTHLLPSHYQSNTIYVYSTDFDRTLQSAASLLLGLYPLGTGPYIEVGDKPALPMGYQPIPIHTVSLDLNPIIPNPIDTNVERSIEKYVYSLAKWRQKENELKKYFPHWSQSTGIKISKLEDLDLLADTLRIYQSHNLPMPQGLSKNDLRLIMETAQWEFIVIEHSRDIKKIYNRQLIKNIGDFLKKASKRETPLKYVLISAHDITIASTLNLLGSPLSISPPYASDLNFSLYETDTKHYIVKITYNGEPVFLPSCDGSVCQLEQFIRLVSSGNV